NCQTALTFKTPTVNANSSYENTVIDRCFINLFSNNAVGIKIENGAHFSNSRLTNTRIWMHTNNTQTQTGLQVEGKMTNTVLSGVVFESFGNGKIYGIVLREDSTGFSDEGISFIGKNWWAKISNPHGIHMSGVFRANSTITFDDSIIGETLIHRDPFTIDSFGAVINITNISPNEQVTVQITLNFRDHTQTSVTLPIFTENQTYELTAQDFYRLYPSQNTIQNIEFFAQTSLIDSKTKVTVGVFGTVS
ncbi:MAG: hypothetical protein JSV76_05400, partial [Candidatus Bathyarchaeota archaeon]